MNIPTPIKWLIGSALALLGVYVITSNKKRAIPALLFANSCANASLPTVFKPVGFSEDEIQQIKNDAEDWNSKSKGKYSVIIDENAPDGASIIRKVNIIEGKPEASGACIAKVDVGGIRVDDSCITGHDIQNYDIQVNPNPSGGPFPVKCTVLHELGHVFGKDDNSNPSSIMSEYTNVCELSDYDVE